MIAHGTPDNLNDINIVLNYLMDCYVKISIEKKKKDSILKEIEKNFNDTNNQDWFDNLLIRISKL
jgi:hypothetical protein